MKKKVFSLLMVIMLVCISGCSEKESKQFGFSIPVKGLEWGMTKEEAVKILGEKYTVDEDASDDYMEFAEFEKSVKAFGEEAKISVGFITNKKPDGEKYYEGLKEEILARVMLTYPEKEGKKAYDKIVDTYGTSDVEFWGLEGSHLYASEDKMNDIPEETREAAFESYSKGNGIDAGESEKDAWFDSEVNTFAVLQGDEEQYAVDMYIGNLLYVLDVQ